GWYDLAIGVDPANPDIVIAGGLNFYRTINGGITWTQITRWVGTALNYVHADHHTVTWNGSQVLVGTDGGIFYSSDNGITYTDRNNGLRLKQFYACAIHPTSTNYFLAGAQDNGVHQLNGAGITNSVEVTGGDGAYVHIDEDEPAYQWGSYVRNNYRRSVNSGASWSSVTADNSGSFINPTDYDDINNIMYCGRNANEFNRWADAKTGGTLTTVAMAGLAGGSVSHVKVSPYTTNRVFFGGSTGKILRADNANAVLALTDITGSGMSASTVSCVAVGTTDNNLLATFSNYGATHIWVSTTGGGAAGWTNITGSGLPDIPIRWAMFNPEDNTKAILATEMGIYETSSISGGATVWVQNGTLPVVKTTMLQYRFNDNTLLASTHGRGLWTSTITPTAPYVRFASSYTYSPVRTEATVTTTGCRNYTDYTLNMHIDKAPVGAAAVTLSIAGGATATQGIDYDFTTNGNFAAPSSVVTFPGGGTADQAITIRVYNDVEVDAAATESFTFTYTIGGGTDALPAPSSTNYTYYIADNDVAPTTTAVETVAGRTKTEHIGNSGTYNFYASTGGLLLNSITGATGSLGCVTSTIFEAGTTWQPLAGGLRSQKVYDIAPTTNPGSTYTVKLYFTTAELTGSGAIAPFSTLKIAKTTAATMAGVTVGNTVVVSTTSAVYNGTNYVFTATFTGFSKFFLINPAVALPVDLLSFSGYLNNQGNSALQWQTTNQYNLSNFEVQRSYDGAQFGTVGTVNAVQNPALIQNYTFVDPQVAKAVNFFRLKMVDRDGRYKYSAIVRINNNKPQKFVSLVQNPVRENISFIINNQYKENVSGQMYNSSGQLVKRWELGKIEGYVVLPFNGARPASGIYTLRLSAGNKTDNLRISIQ
ncbi:MAG: T9SS type A sorting domain-containing protein, partial [Chitinophagaceae bacterium]